MENLSRRRVLTLGAALGLTSVALEAPSVWSWSSKGSIAHADTITDPFQVWDPAADQVAARLLADGSIPAVNAAWNTWRLNKDPLPSGMPDYLVSYLQEHNKLPSWADPTKLAKAQALYKRLSGYLFISESLGSGFLSTVIPREARSVYWSAGGANMQDRAAKTFTFGYDLHNEKAFDPTGSFVTTANKTRLVHAMVRNLLPLSPHFQATADQPLPISNGDILVTFHSVGTVAYNNIEKWGVRTSASEEVADLHAWQVALSLLGVQDQFIPQTWADAKAQAQAMLWPRLAATAEGNDLAQRLLDAVKGLGTDLSTGFVSEMVRYLIGDTYWSWLGLPTDLISRALIKVNWPLYVAFREGTSLILPSSFNLFDGFVRGISMMYLNNGASATQTPITLPSANRPGA
ncbi:oxygenase MpaB family protein [Actinocorallia aurea]